MTTYRVFTIESGVVKEGAAIETLNLKGAGISIPALLVGEEGRGRELGVVPVGNPPMVPCPEQGMTVWSGETCTLCKVKFLGDVKAGYAPTRTHPEEGTVQGRLMFAEVGQTKGGRPKAFSKEWATTNETILVIFRTKSGFRGNNSHTGDRLGWKCGRTGCDASGSGDAPETCPKCTGGGWGDSPSLEFVKFPGQVIAKGRIAQGDAGRAGGGEQMIALVPKGVVFRTAYSGRLYGAPSAHYYKWDGSRLLAATWEERATSDLF